MAGTMALVKGLCCPH